MGSQFIRVFIPFFLLAYFLGGIATVRTDRLYPLDSWTLYVKMPNKVDTYTLNLYVEDAKGITSVVLLED